MNERDLATVLARYLRPLLDYSTKGKGKLGGMEEIAAGASGAVMRWTREDSVGYDGLALLVEKPGVEATLGEVYATLAFGADHANAAASAEVDCGMGAVIRLPGEAGDVKFTNGDGSVAVRAGAFLCNARTFRATRTKTFSSLADAATSSDIARPNFAVTVRPLLNWAGVTGPVLIKQENAAGTVIVTTEHYQTTAETGVVLHALTRNVGLTNNTGATIADGALLFELGL